MLSSVIFQKVYNGRLVAFLLRAFIEQTQRSIQASDLQDHNLLF